MNKKNEISTKQTKTKDEPEAENSSRASGRGVFMMRGKGQSIEEYANNVIRALREQGMLKEKPGITGGDGSSTDNALVVNATSTQKGVSLENEYIENKCGKWDIDYTIDRQIQIDHNRRKYDLIYVTMKKDGSKREYWFDVTSFFGKL